MSESIRRHRTAGGVVFDDTGRMLAIVRDIEREGVVRHEVRLPKGHLDLGETDEQAAVREVCEETGYCSLVVVDDLGEMISEYVLNGQHNVRTERYFLMRTTGEAGAPAPVGPEEALFTVCWLHREEVPEHLTYPTEKEFARRAIAAWERRNAS